MTGPSSSDPFWERRYAAGNGDRYPWDAVVSFVFRNCPKDKPRNAVSILEVGCGAGANLWFAAREGFRVFGIDGSASAIALATDRFARDGLVGDLRVGDFTDLPFTSASCDLAIDRASLTCVGTGALRTAIREVRRVLRPGGRFLFTPYADSHSSMRSSKPGSDGLRVDITAGSLVGAGAIRFASRAELDELFAEGWRILSLQRLEVADMLGVSSDIHSAWRIVVEKVDGRAT